MKNKEIGEMNELETIRSRIHEIRGAKVMLDFDLAKMYGVEVKALNQAVKRNIERFPEDFMFQLTKGEWEILRSQIVTANLTENQEDNYLRSQFVTANTAESVSLRSQNETLKGMSMKRYQPYAFTEQGVAMLSSVLRSPLAIQVNIGIMRAFVTMRHALTAVALPAKVEELERPLVSASGLSTKISSLSTKITHCSTKISSLSTEKKIEHVITM